MLLDYSFLKGAAERCRLQFERGNPSVQVLLSYCQKQTGWESPTERSLSGLAADLATRYPGVIAEMRSLWHSTVLDWTPSMLAGHGGELRVFQSQHYRLCELLLRSAGIAALKVQLRAALSVEDQRFVGGRTWFDVAPAEVDDLCRDGEWPVFINVFKLPSQDADTVSRYTTRLVVSEQRSHVDRAAPP